MTDDAIDAGREIDEAISSTRDVLRGNAGNAEMAFDGKDQVERRQRVDAGVA